MIASATTHSLWQTQLFAKHNGEKMATVKRCILLSGGHLSNHKDENIDLAQRIGPWEPNSRKYECRYKHFTLSLSNSHYNSSLGWQFLDYFWLSDLFVLSKFQSVFAAPNLSHSNFVFCEGQKPKSKKVVLGGVMCWTISWLCIVAFWSLHRLLGNLTPMTRLQEVSAPNGPRKGTIKGPCSVQGKGHVTERGGQKQLQATFCVAFLTIQMLLIFCESELTLVLAQLTQCMFSFLQHIFYIICLYLLNTLLSLHSFSTIMCLTL